MTGLAFIVCAALLVFGLLVLDVLVTWRGAR